MKNFNITFLVLIFIGMGAVLVGAFQKINGNTNYYYLLNAGLIIEFVAVLFLAYWNMKSMKKITEQ